ncbi:hypothetical protein G5I_04966 [Acromyrmex echinatior]|uniref:Uncharacterized protein n=1 Tax=Acromyrmex echinatior TaxID=103372 RepID=F4WH14_ACREC|nr:hypothetical protein G5I_04966 [Acromyrmex echinatior]
MGFIIAVFPLVTDHQGLPRTIARANNFTRTIMSYAINSSMSSTTNGQLTLVNSHDCLPQICHPAQNSLSNNISIYKLAKTLLQACYASYVISHQVWLGKSPVWRHLHPWRERQEPLR